MNEWKSGWDLLVKVRLSNQLRNEVKTDVHWRNTRHCQRQQFTWIALQFTQSHNVYVFFLKVLTLSTIKVIVLGRVSPTPVKSPVYWTPVISNCQLNRTREQKLTFAQLQLADCVVNLLSDAAIGWEVLLSSMTLAAVCVTFVSQFYFLTWDLTGDCGSVKSNWGLTLD